MSDKNTYYVSVQAKTVTEHQGDAAYEFEIEATSEQVRQLLQLFNATNADDLHNYWRVHAPDVVVDEVTSNTFLDDHLTEIYRLLHRIGTPETRSHIESMNVLQGIQHGYSRGL